MQLLFDFFPLLAFFVAFIAYDLYVATATIMVAVALQIAYQWLRHRKVSKMLLISGAVLWVFGGLTLAFRNPLFIQWKVTVVNWLFAVGFFGSQFIGQKTFIERIMGHAVRLEAAVWRQINTLWVVTFAGIGALNLYFMYNYDETTWAYFKVWGVIGILVLLMVATGFWISARAPDTETDKPSQ
jgi:intracellular septation protein